MVIRFHTVLLSLHLLSLAIGLGAALLADWIVLTQLMFAPVSERSSSQLRDLSHAVSLGLILLWITGGLLVWDNAVYQPTSLHNHKLWAKVVIVAILTANAMLLHKLAFPLVQARIGQMLFRPGQRTIRTVCTLAAAVSLGSWVSAMYLGVARELNGVVAITDVLADYSGVVLLIWVAGIVLCYMGRPRPSMIMND